MSPEALMARPPLLEAKSHLSPGTPKASTDNQLFDEEEDQSLATIREFHILSAYELMCSLKDLIFSIFIS